MTTTEELLLPDPEIEEDLEQYKLDPGVPEDFERPDLLASELWKIRWHSGKTIAYMDVEGEGPKTVNHLSPVKFTIIKGAGAIATRTSLWEFDVKDDGSGAQSFIVPRAQQYEYEGRFNAFIELSYPPLQGFTTYNGEPLGKEQRKILSRARRLDARYQFMADLDKKMGISTAVMQITRLLDGRLSTPEDEASIIKAS